MEMDEKTQRALEDDMLKFMAMKHLNAQQKYNEIQKLAKKYDMPLEKLLKNIITGWVNEDKEKKFSGKPQQKPQNKPRPGGKIL